MKRKITLLLFAVGAMFAAQSQVVLSEDFTDPFVPGTGAAADWVIVDNTSPGGSGSWSQGNQTGGNGTLTAYNGLTDDFFMADFTAVNGTTGDISAFLITPTLSIYNGAELKFATRTLQFSGAALFPDRMQVLMSQNGNTTAVAGSTASVGSFTDVLLDINPNLGPGTSSVVNNGTVNGYPQSWVVYTIPITNVTGTVTGRFAFRYFVQNGGSGGGNSRLVALDAVRFTLPCGTAQSYTTCAGATTTLNALGGTAASSFSWSTGSTGNTTTVNPSSTTVYSLFTTVGGSVSCAAAQSTITVSSQLSMQIAANHTLVCAGQPVVLTSTSAASTYSWANGTGSIIGSGTVVTVTPTVSQTYSVGGANGLCFGGNTVAITVNPLPTVTATTANTLICTTGATASVTFSASGTATAYVWSDAVGNAVLAVGQVTAITIPSVTALSNFSIRLSGIDANGCIGSSTLPITVAIKPVVTATITKNPICTNNTLEFAASGADSYTWTAPGSTLTGNGDSFTAPSGTTTGNRTYTVVGINADGCTASKSMVVSVNACLGIEKVEGDNGASHVFPNPFANQLTISGIKGEVVVYNVLGQSVLTLGLDGSDHTINTSELPKGAYILKAYANGVSIKTIKLVKN